MSGRVLPSSWSSGDPGWFGSASLPTRMRWLCELLAVIALIGWLDLVTGPDVGLALFYLVPIVIAGWRVGRTPALIGAVAAAIAWFIADIHWHRAGGWAVSTWNGSTRLAIFVAMGFMTARLRADEMKMRALLSDALRLARTDSLTGLANSRSFFEYMHDHLRARSEGTRVALVYFDVDNFKRVNDLEGHDKGDEVLRAIAERVGSHVRKEDFLARLGGDEFALVLVDQREENVEGLIARLVAEIEDLGRLHPGSGLGLSAGVVHATCPIDAVELLRRADAEMYANKGARKLATASDR